MALFDLADALDHVQLLAVDHAHLVDPRAVVESQGVDHQRVSLPVADRVSQERRRRVLHVGLVHVDVPDVVRDFVHDRRLAVGLNDLDRVRRIHDSRYAVRPAVCGSVGDRRALLLRLDSLVPLFLAVLREWRQTPQCRVDLPVVETDEPDSREVTRIAGGSHRADERPVDHVRRLSVRCRDSQYAQPDKEPRQQAQSHRLFSRTSARSLARMRTIGNGSPCASRCAAYGTGDYTVGFLAGKRR